MKDDTPSNPHADAHLPVAGEFDAANIPQQNPLTTDTDNIDDVSPDTEDEEGTKDVG